MNKYYLNINKLNISTKQDLQHVLLAAYQKGYCDREREVPLDPICGVDDIDKLAHEMLNKCRVYTACYNSLKENERQYFLDKRKKCHFHTREIDEGFHKVYRSMPEDAKPVMMTKLERDYMAAVLDEFLNDGGIQEETIVHDVVNDKSENKYRIRDFGWKLRNKIEGNYNG